MENQTPEPINTNTPVVPSNNIPPFLSEPSAPPTPPTPLNIPTDIPPKPKNIFAPFLIAMLVILGLGSLGFWAYQNYFVSSELPAKTDLPTPIATVDPTISWETYTNTEIGFSFKYPSEWKVQNKIPNSGLISLETNDGNRFFAWFSQSVSLAEWLEETESGKIIGKKTVGDYIFTVVQGGIMANSLEYVVDIKGKGIIRFVIEPNTNTAKSEETFDQILSTFKFIDLTKEPVVTTPTKDSKVSSPLTITGTVPAGWMFEGSFPIKLVDSKKNLIAQGSGKETVPGSWMNGKPTSFSVTLPFSTTEVSGFLILMNDNPSGDPAKALTFELPVKF